MKLLAFWGEGLALLMEKFVYSGRYILAPMYCGLVVAILLYSYKFTVELYELCHKILHISEEQLMLGVLSLVDITMVGNLIVMIMIGGWHIFVKKLNISERPQWLDHLDTGILKVKMGMSLVGVSSIHLLKAFVDPAREATDDLNKQVMLHIVFVVSTLVMAIIHKLGHSKHD